MENIIIGLCPRNWENTDITPLSELQINGVLDNCEKCKKHSQCNKVAELNDRLIELHEEGEPSSRIYTLIVTKNDEETSFDDIMNTLQDIPYIQDIELLESYEEKIRVELTTDYDISFDTVCSYLERNWEVDVELIEEHED